MCVQKSFEVEGDYESDNTIFRDDRKWARKMNLGYHPSVTINEFTYRGALTYKDLTQAICAAFNFKLSECDFNQIWRQHTDPEAYEV